MKNKNNIIYKIRNLLNGKVYIGQSNNIKNRFNGHKHHTKTNKKHPLYDSMRKYGIENFEIIILEWVDSITKLNEREQYWMGHYKSYDRNFGYNLRSKAESNRGMKCSEETKIKQSIAHLGQNTWSKNCKLSIEHKSKISNKLKGRIFSDETRKKLSVANTGYKHTEETINKMKGKKHSEETRNKMALAKIGTTRKFTPEHKENLKKAWQIRKLKKLVA